MVYENVLEQLSRLECLILIDRDQNLDSHKAFPFSSKLRSLKLHAWRESNSEYITQFSSLKSLALTGSLVQNHTLDQIAKLRQLEYLSLTVSADSESFDNLTNLTQLELRYENKITGKSSI